MPCDEHRSRNPGGPAGIAAAARGGMPITMRFRRGIRAGLVRIRIRLRREERRRSGTHADATAASRGEMALCYRRPIRAAHCPVHATHGPARAAHCPVRAAHCPVRAAHCPVRAAHCPALPGTCSTLPCTCSTLLSTRSTLPFTCAHCPVRTSLRIHFFSDHHRPSVTSSRGHLL